MLSRSISYAAIYTALYISMFMLYGALNANLKPDYKAIASLCALTAFIVPMVLWYIGSMLTSLEKSAVYFKHISILVLLSCILSPVIMRAFGQYIVAEYAAVSYYCIGMAISAAVCLIEQYIDNAYLLNEE